MLLFAVSACRERNGIIGGEVIDSAGISIVLNHPRTSDLESWSTEPSLTIGRIDGPREYTFGRIADVDIDARGRLLVLDRQSRYANVYGPDGRYRFRLGGPGEGPGELSGGATEIRAGPGDSIAILDYGLRRLNVYGMRGEPARTVTLRVDRPGPYGFHWLRDGRLLIRWLTYGQDRAGRFVLWDALLLSDEPGTSHDTLLVFDYRPPDLGDHTRLLRPLFHNVALYDVLRDGRIIWSALENDQVAVHDRDGTLRSMIRSERWVRRPVTPADREALEAVYRAGADDPAAPIPENVLFPDTVPSITAVLASPDGGFWVQRMGPLADTDPEALFLPVDNGWLGGPEWEVYDADGRCHAVVAMPPRFRVMRVRDSVVVGVHRDDLDVERVVLLRLRKDTGRRSDP